MITPPVPPGLRRVLRDAIRFINPFVPDDHPPKPPLPVWRLRVCGGAGALAAVAAVASTRVEAFERATTDWNIAIYVTIVVILIGTGMSMGEKLTERASYKVVFGVLIATLVVICLIRVILAQIPWEGV